MFLYFFQAFIPIINLLFLYLLVISYVHLKKLKKTIKENKELVYNPMQHMIDQDELCKTLGREYLIEKDQEKDGVKIYYSN